MRATSFSKLALSSLLALASIASGFFSKANAGEFGLPLSILSETVDKTSDSQIVIRVRTSYERNNLCGTGFNLSRLGIDNDGFDFPRPGAGIGRFDFPRPSGSLSYFQLPVGAKNPDIIGCVDTQRNIVFLNILKPPAPQPVTPQPTPVPTYPPTQSNPNDPAQTYPLNQVDPNYPRLK